ncbi:hypothetical protein M8J75_004170 [Diaphorina citri]|uniref:ATP-binding cassette sub-family G member 16 n=1 Tax=Diaphorina citri TaxID=121845 RepID=A0A451FTC2_DIACI|nr:hypothetical protein M8J75_004170 [Diaphorina citri]QAA95932.1 ATP-binding cassette sub-family G member 16 [Diaphorina citri]
METFHPLFGDTNYKESLSGRGLTLSWNNLSIYGKRRDPTCNNFWRPKIQRFKLLHKVSGIAESGSLLAIMGPSGAGKTTLLACISQRIQGDVDGQILLNGLEVEKNLMVKVSGFVPQHDLTVDTLTVHEHMTLMARLKMDRNLHHVERARTVDALLKELGLLKCKNSVLNVLSGGERKRVALAVQLLTDPSLLFCDEPTTGLDSFSAISVIEMLRTLASYGKTIVCSIHQPASGLFDLFDNISLLVTGGELAYHGPVSKVTDYFNKLDMVCPPSYNVAEYLVNQLAITPNGDKEKRQERVRRVCAAFSKSKAGRDLTNKLDNLIYNSAPASSAQTWSTASSLDTIVTDTHDEFIKFTRLKPPSQWIQFTWLLWRTQLDAIRKPQDTLLRFAFYMFIALLISFPYIGIQIDQYSVQNIQGLLYLVIVETVFTYSYSVYNTFPQEMPILLREINNDLYKPAPYYASKMICLLPRSIIEPLIYSAVVFWVVGLFGGISGFILFSIPVILSATAATAYGCFISAVFDSIATASLASVPIEFVSLSFCGIYLNFYTLPFYTAWIKYLSMFYFGIEAVSIVQWSEIDKIACNLNVTVSDFPCEHLGDIALDRYGYSESHFSVDILGLVFIYCVAHVFGYISFVRRSKRQPVY